MSKKNKTTLRTDFERQIAFVRKARRHKVQSVSALLVLLRIAEEPSRETDLANYLQITPSGMNSLLANLVAKKLVERYRKDDGREVWYRLGAGGLEVVK